jgi:hypothetical protein
METKMKSERRLTLKQMEPIARQATLTKITNSEMNLTEEDKSNLVLCEYINNQFGIFQLIIPGERPIDAKIISRAYVDRITGELTKVELNPTIEFEL